MTTPKVRGHGFRLGAADNFKKMPGFSETVTTAATAKSADPNVYETQVITGGAARELNLGAATGITVGHRKLITLQTLTTGGDTVVLDHANFSQAALTVSAAVLDAADEYILLEARGAKWEIISSTAGVVTAA